MSPARALCRCALAWPLALLAAACAALETAPPAPPPPVETAAPPPEPAPPDDSTPTLEPTPALGPAPTGPILLRIAAVGDIMLGTDFPQNILADDDAVSFLAQAAPVLSAADLAFGNLEGTLMDGGEPVKQCHDPSACFLFRSPSRYAEHLARAGFDLISLANNHARDFGEEGRSASMQALDAVGIAHSGREGDVALVEVNGLLVALIAFAPNVGANPMLDPDYVATSVRALAAGNDIVVVSFHGGAEGAEAGRLPFADEIYYGEARGNVVAFARAAIEAGADLVIGHGPHVPRALEIHDDRLIAYSLGNFATYYGISVEGAKGYAPILLVTLDGEGRFVEGRIESMIQLRPGGPQPDPERRAYRMIRELTELDFGPVQLRFTDDGGFSARP